MIRYLLILIFVLCKAHCENEQHFVVVIPSYNNKNWYERNLDSVRTQNYPHFRIVYIDDASTDGTAQLVRNYIAKYQLEDKMTLIQNRMRGGALSNVYKGVWLCAADEIVVNLDGDDWLKDENVLTHLSQIYSDPDVWVTYGQFEYYPCNSPGWAAEVAPEIIEHNAFRDYRWTTTALRTFYAGLFHLIRIDDLLYNGAFFPMAGDLAYMWPILEMAGFHSRFIPDVLYVYNIDTPINDIKIDPDYQEFLGLETRKKDRYHPLDKLFY